MITNFQLAFVWKLIQFFIEDFTIILCVMAWPYERWLWFLLLLLSIVIVVCGRYFRCFTAELKFIGGQKLRFTSHGRPSQHLQHTCLTQLPTYSVYLFWPLNVVFVASTISRPKCAAWWIVCADVSCWFFRLLLRSCLPCWALPAFYSTYFA